MQCKYSRSALTTLAVLIMTPLTGFAEDEEVTEAVSDEPEAICFNADRVRNFDGLSDNYLYIEVNSSQRYLMSMKGKCFGLKGAQVFAFKDTMRRVCSSDSFTEIVIRDMGSPMRCGIDTFEQVEDKETAKELVAEYERVNDSD